MVGAYGTYVNKGIWTEPIFIERIEDHNGNVLYTTIPNTKAVLSEDQAAVMVHLLKGGTEEKGGTSQALFQYDIFRGNEIGGKTGTTSNYSDGWFMGDDETRYVGMFGNAKMIRDDFEFTGSYIKAFGKENDEKK
jgi:penicillin-binding protein 1A